MNLKYYKELDGVRGLAALMVMIFHFAPDSNIYYLHLLKKIAVFGQTGVTLFFVLSGFLITRILLRARSKEGYFKNFYMKRLLRIFPLYYFFLIIYYFVVPSLFHQPAAPFSKTWYYWFYLQNFADTFNWPNLGPQHYWSLAVEEHFYFFWPLIVYYLSEKNIHRLVYWIIGLAFVCRIILILNGYGTFYFTFTTMDCLAMGALLAISEQHGSGSYKHWRVLAIISIGLLLPMWFIFNGAGNTLIQIVKLPTIALFYTSIIGCLITRRSVLNRFFDLRFLQFTGKISYGLYVFHPLCFTLIDHFINPNNLFINAALSFFVSYAVAFISFYGFENHFIKLKRYFEIPTLKESTHATEIVDKT